MPDPDIFIKKDETAQYDPGNEVFDPRDGHCGISSLPTSRGEFRHAHQHSQCDQDTLVHPYIFGHTKTPYKVRDAVVIVVRDLQELVPDFSFRKMFLSDLLRLLCCDRGSLVNRGVSCFHCRSILFIIFDDLTGCRFNSNIDSVLTCNFPALGIFSGTK